MTKKEELEFIDSQMASRVVDEELNGRFLFARGLGWLLWNGKYWQQTEDAAPREAVRQWALRQYRDAVQRLADALARQDSADAYVLQQEVSRWRAYNSAAKIKWMTDLAKGMLLRDYTDFDVDPDVINCESGILDMRTGVVMPHDPEAMITKFAPVSYVEGATHPDWDAALEAVPEDCRQYYQQKLGQAITGYMSPDDVLLVQQGIGSNGKSTVMLAVRAALGDYFHTVSDRALLADSNAHTTELASFRGARLAYLDELPEQNNRHMPVVRVKKLVGTPVIKARFMRQDDMEFENTSTLILSSNYTPTVAETDEGTWRRFALLKFPFHFCKPDEIETQNDRKADPGLRARWLDCDDARREAVFAWLVDGARDFYERDRWQYSETRPEVPDRIKDDTLEWRKLSDTIMAYILDNIEFDADRHVLCEDLYEHYNEWMQANGYYKVSTKTFVQRFGDHDLVKKRRFVGRKTLRCNDELSRPGPGPMWYNRRPVKDVYKAWVGVKFREETDIKPNQMARILAEATEAANRASGFWNLFTE